MQDDITDNFLSEFLSDSYASDAGQVSVDIDTKFAHQHALYKALDHINGYDDADAAMINFILDADTYCFESYAQSGKIAWVNTRTREFHDLDSNVIRDNLLAVFGGKAEDASKRLRKKRKFATFTYNPYTIRLEFTEKDIRHFNTYQPPEWKLSKYKAQLPEKINTFMKHLFPKDDSREYVFDWLANGLRSRNLTYLFLLSTQGAGKGIFSNIVKALYGKQNAVTAGQTFINKEFNDFIRDKQLLILNEITVTDAEGLDKLKTLVDEYVMIEGKSVNAFEQRNHLNVIFTINRPDAIEIEDNDRRYSIVHLSPKPLKDVVSEEDVGLYAEMHRDEELIGQFGQWLIERKIERNMLQKYVDDEKMHEIDEELLFGWQKFIINEVCKHTTKLTNPFTSADLNNLMIQSDVLTRPVGWNKLHVFITKRCGGVLRCRRNKDNPAILDIEFVNPKKVDDKIQF